MSVTVGVRVIVGVFVTVGVRLGVKVLLGVGLSVGVRVIVGVAVGPFTTATAFDVSSRAKVSLLK